MQHREAARKSEYFFRKQAREGLLLEVGRIVRDLTPARAEDLLQMASESPWICYDGDARLVQIRKAELVWEKGPQDRLYLQSLKEPGHWYGYEFPINASVDSASLDNNFLTMRVSGEIVDGVVLPAGSPVTIRLAWKRGSTTPPNAPLKAMLDASWKQNLKTLSASKVDAE
ncbi:MULTISPECIES: hypothetical protein [Rhodopirellula]|uniref:hypothetical protein n=1 Tax=Rhodopirellula TaxID=265488 RepID=UPI00257F942A|nr:hypothetical protein [Rhodopirellula sp. UBA1907]